MGSQDDRTDPLAATVSGEAADSPAIAETLASGDDSAGAKPPEAAALPTVSRDVYRIEGEVARGGMGRIVRARDARIGRAVAIKEALSSEPTFVARFEREAVITARLQHPSIVPVYEAGRWPEGDPFYAMKLVAGRPLDRVIAGAADTAARVALVPHVIQVCEALAYAHDRGIVHRDLKPGNVLVGDYGETVVIDWGLAKDTAAAEPDGPIAPARPEASASGSLTRVGAALGTPAYMPPEQARGDAIDARADVYALGALLYHVLAGAMPYSGAVSPESLLDAVLAGPPPPLVERAPGVPAELAAIAARAMERDPSGRYPSARELAADLRRFEAGQLVSVHRYSTREIVWRWARRHRGTVATAAVLLGVLAVVAVVSVRSVMRARDLAEARAAQVLEDQGRQELAAGHTARALPYLIEAWRTARAPSPTLSLLLGEARPAISDIVRVVPPTSARIASVDAAADGTLLVQRDDDTVALAPADGRAPRPITIAGEDARWWLSSFSRDSARVVLAGEKVHVLDVARAAEVATIDVAADAAHVEGDRALTSLDNDDQATLWDLTAHPPRAIATWKDVLRADFATWRGRAVVVAVEKAPEAVGAVGAAGTADAGGDAGAGEPAGMDDRTPAGRAVVAYDPATGAALGAIVTAGGAGGAGVGATKVSLSDDARWAFAVTQGSSLGGQAHHDAVRATELATGRVLVVDVIAHSVRGVAVTPRGDRVIIRDQRTLTVLDPADDRVVAEIDRDEPIDDVLALDLGGHPAFALPAGDSIDLYDATVGVRVARLDGHVGTVRVAIAAPGGRQLVTGGDDGRVVVWAPSLGLDASALGAVSASPDGRRLAVVEGATVRVTGDMPATYDARGGVRTIDVAWGADRIAIVDDGGALAIVPMRGGAPVRAATSAYGCAFDPAGARVVTLEGRRLRVWRADAAAPPLATLDGQRDVIARVRWFPDGSHVVSAGDDGQVRVWPAGGGPGVVLEDGRGPVGSLAVSSDSARIAVASGDGKVRVYAASGAREAELPGFGSTVTVLAFAPGGGTLATGGDDGTVRLWSMPDGRQIAALDHGAATAGIAFRADGAVLATASADLGGLGPNAPPADVRLWDARTGVLLGTRAGTGELGFAADGHALVVRGDSGVAVWHLDDADLGVAMLAARADAVGAWRLAGGQLVPTTAPQQQDHSSARAKVYDFEEDVVEGELPRPGPVTIARGESPVGDALADAAELLAKGRLHDAAAAAAKIDGAALARADQLYVLAFARYAAGDADGALRWARASAERAGPGSGKDAAVDAVVAFAPRAAAAVDDVLAGLHGLAASDETLLALAGGYALRGRIDDAFAVLDAIAAGQGGTGSAAIDARLAAARIASASDRPSDEARYLVAAQTAAAAPTAPAGAADSVHGAMVQAIVALRLEFKKTRDRRYRDAAHALDRAAPATDERDAAAAADFARDVAVPSHVMLDRDKAQIRRTFRARGAAFRVCYERALLDAPALAGTVTLRLTIDAIGGVEALDAQPTEPAMKPVADCMAEQVRGWIFEGQSSGGRIVVTYPIVFKPTT